MRRWLSCVVLFVLGLVTGSLHAQGDLEVSAELSHEVVEVGASFILTFKVMSERGVDASRPRLRLPPGLRASAPSMGTSTVMQFGPGTSMVRRGVTVQWRLQADKPGSYMIPPPTLVLGNDKVSAPNSMRVKVVPADPRGSGLGSPPGGVTQLDPFNPFGGSPFGDLFKDLERRRDDGFVDEPVDYDSLGFEGRGLVLRAAPDRYLFLRVKADKEQVVVGQQVTLSWYLYYRVQHNGGIDREPDLPDFMRLPLTPGRDVAGPKITTGVAGRTWFAKRLGQLAVFPLRTGKLQTGTVHGEFQVPYLRNRVVQRTSNELTIDVREPPLEGRPPGYRVGDVGRFSLSAEVAPRETKVGESVSVKVTVQGRGALPGALQMPERTGLSWLSPEKKENVDVVRDEIGGWRSFGYAVRLDEPGKVDLGEAKLAFWDAARRQYKVARARLGFVTVSPKAEQPTGKAKEPGEDPFATAGKPRPALGEYQASSGRALGPRLFWPLVLLPPLGVALAGLGRRAFGALRRRREEHGNDPATLARRALAGAKTAGDDKDRAAAFERAIHHAVEAATSLKSRGVLVAELEDELGERGLDEKLAAEAVAVLALCADLRFAPDAEAARDLDGRARAVVKQLLQRS